MQKITNNRDVIVYFLTIVIWTILFFCPMIVKYCIYFDAMNDTTHLLICSLTTSLLLSSICTFFKHKQIGCVIFCIFLLSTLTELIMISCYQSLMDIDHLMATITTTIDESIIFAQKNITSLWYIIPIILLSTVLCVLFCKTTISLKTRIIVLCISFLIWSASIVPYQLIINTPNISQLKSAVFKNTFSRPPFSIPHLFKVCIRQIYRNNQSIDFAFQSTRKTKPSCKETYILAIGESVRERNCSLGGYRRETMPLLGKKNNIIHFSNYYSGACTTSSSIPMIVTRATASTPELAYTEHSIAKVFKENGFVTYTIQRGLFSQISAKYLTTGTDYYIEASSDQQVIDKIDSISCLQEKTFIMFQFLGSHFYYDNFTTDFNIWRPNSVYDKESQSDSLLINSYDNTILYTDKLLSDMIDSLQDSGLAVIWYVSDHGQTINAKQGWHGTICDENEYHVPFIIWYSNEYEQFFQQKIHNLFERTQSPINSDCIFYTICGMSDISLPIQYDKPTWDVSSIQFSPHTRMISVANKPIEVE